MSRDPNLSAPLAEWGDTFQVDDTSGSPISPPGTVYFVYGRPGSAIPIGCKVERVPDWRGDPQPEAVIVKCPMCGSTGRAAIDLKPFRIEQRRVMMRTRNGAVPVEPLLTILSPYVCGACVTITDTDTGVRQEAECPFSAVIRGGIAFDSAGLTGPTGALTRLLHTTHEKYERAQKLFATAGGVLPPETQVAASGDLARMFQALAVVVPTIESGNYERDGLQSIVGCMDELERICVAADRIVAAIQATHGARP